MYTLRASPCAGHQGLMKVDALLRKAVCSIANADLSDLQWLQASLPVSLGGLGIRSVSMLAPSAYLASAAETRILQNSILPSHVGFADPEWNRIANIWSSYSSVSVPSCNTVQSQKVWDQAIVLASKAQLRSNAEVCQDKARLLAVSASHSGDWLNALPISSCGLRLDDEAVRVAVGLRLGARLCEPHSCVCGAAVNSQGTHGLACKRSAGRIGRHQFLNDIVWRALNRANVPSIKEPVGLLRSDGKKPDGVTQIPWSEGKCLAWDVTLTDTLTASNLVASSSAAGGAAENAAVKKIHKYSALASKYTFVPIAFETMGPVNVTAEDFINSVGDRTHALTGDSREKQFLWQRLSLALQRYNALCFRGTFGQATTDQN